MDFVCSFLAFGGNLRLMVVASAPLAGNVLTFMRCALGCLVIEGYGQTECTGAITLTVQGDYVPNHVGPPVSCNAVKVRKNFRNIYENAFIKKLLYFVMTLL